MVMLAVGVTGLSGCGESASVNVNVSENSELSGNTFGVSNLIEIGGCLYYDSTTRIVYWWNGCILYDVATTPTPYYAPNGKPYRYNLKTNTFEEIE